ncbi:hypothetical protein BK672_16660 [Pseudomonas fluorescens]|uniref:Iron-containing redox enzyme family protein n=1 Tax=Pseudomonas fluorescens TaxID=294 RepID=A0A423N7A3_PSEFL|nr:iron-containing redox enzyme family protein [Pseudomonas fluorescens]RON93916.1 hypothetical protein BK672_16660 [Pseudomonas fluorescens]
MTLQDRSTDQTTTPPSTINSLSEQTALNSFYLRELAEPSAYKMAPIHHEYTRPHRLEDEWNAYEESRLDKTRLPKNAAEFLKWYTRLHSTHRDEVSAFFTWLAEESTLEELSFYIAMEEQVDGRFDDVIALAQLGMTGDMKLALAENYWDEMGLGTLSEMHTVLFRKSAATLHELIGPQARVQQAPAEALKNGNLLLMYALRRQYHPRLLGALAILEHTAPYRFSRTVKAMRRLHMPEDVIYYHDMHIKIDANHGKQLLYRVLMPLAKSCPEAIEEMCIGCLIRYNVAVDYYKSIELAMKNNKALLT